MIVINNVINGNDDINNFDLFIVITIYYYYNYLLLITIITND